MGLRWCKHLPERHSNLNQQEDVQDLPHDGRGGNSDTRRSCLGFSDGKTMQGVLAPCGRSWAVGRAPALHCGIQAVSLAPIPCPCHPLCVSPGCGYGLADRFCAFVSPRQPIEATPFTKSIVKMWSDQSKEYFTACEA